MDKSKLSKEVLDAVRPSKQSRDGDVSKVAKRNPYPRTPKLEQEKLPQKARDAFQFLRYHHGLSAAKMNTNSSFVYKLENGESVSAEKVSEIIKKVWGFDSFKELIEKADALKERIESKKVTEESGKWADIVSDRQGKHGVKR